MGAWTINSLTAPVTRGLVTPAATNASTSQTKPLSLTTGTGTGTTSTDANNLVSQLMTQLFGGGWQNLANTGDRSGQVGGNSSAVTPEEIYARSAANLMNEKARAMMHAYNPWVQNKLNYEMARLTDSGAGMGMNSGMTSQYSALRGQMQRQMDQQKWWNQTAAAIGSSPVMPMQPAQRNVSSGWVSLGG